MKLSTPIEKISYVGPKNAKRLRKVGIRTLKDLLFYFPRDYEDRTQIISINQATIGAKNTFQAKIIALKSYLSPRKKIQITEAIVEDKTGALPVIWFNQPFIASQLKKGDLVNLIGVPKATPKGLLLSSPEYEVIARKPSKQVKQTIHSGRIVPIYSEPLKLTSKYFRFLIWRQLQKLDAILEFLPPEILSRNKLLPLFKALHEIHFPSSRTMLQAAKKRIAFNELFLLRLYLEKQKIIRTHQQKAYSIPFDHNLVKTFVGQLPFSLTNDQKKTAWQIIKDLEKPYPTQRLLEGDVGSGKTIVAAIASLSVISQGYQVAFLAPTEVLARQHFNQLTQDLQKINITIALLVGSEARIYDPRKKKASFKVKKDALLKSLKDGTINLVIGTHALIQKKVKFAKLAFVVIDEQHRFGVAQRAQLLNINPVVLSGAAQKTIARRPSLQTKNLPNTTATKPHLLSMSATPIPRSLALVFYGDLEISRLKQLPQGRKEILTQVVFPKERPKVYNFIRQEIKKGHQAFVICPLIEESEKLQTKAVTEEFVRLSQQIFPDLKLAMLHGKLKSAEKKQIMNSFAAKKFDVLVSTSVIEVGIDIPNATIMVIEGAERFGLSQLHQLRGRVGRGSAQSYCFLFTEIPSQAVLQRLKILTAVNDGFELAEKDLQLRGPGDFIGVRQSGIPDLVMASLSDTELIRLTKKEALGLLQKDNSLAKYPLLKKIVCKMEETIHLE